MSRAACRHPCQGGASAPSSFAPLPPAILGCHAPAQGFRGCCTLASSAAAAGRVGGCCRGHPYLPSRPGLRQGMGTVFPRAYRARPRHHVRGVRGRPRAGAGSCRVARATEPRKVMRSLFKTYKSKEEVAKREGCSGDGCFLVGEGKARFCRQRLWLARCGGHPRGRARGLRSGAGRCRDQHDQLRQGPGHRHVEGSTRGYCCSVPPNCQGRRAQPPAPAAQGVWSRAHPQLTTPGGARCEAEQPQGPLLTWAPSITAPGPHRTSPHGAGDTGSPADPAK